MPPPAQVFTDNVTLVISAFDLGNQFTCSGNGLFWDRKKKIPTEELCALLDPNVPEVKKDKSKYGSKAILYAQCKFLLGPDEMPRPSANLQQLRTALRTALDSGRAPPPKLLALERTANQQFNNMLQLIGNIVANTKYIPPAQEPTPGAVAECALVTPRPRKRNRKAWPSNESHCMLGVAHEAQFPASTAFTPAHGSHMSLDTPPPVLGPTDDAPPQVEPEPQGIPEYLDSSKTTTPPANAALPPMSNKNMTVLHAPVTRELIIKHSRGDRSAARAPNTERLRARRPHTTARSFLLQLMVSLGDWTRALRIASEAPAPADPSTKVSTGSSESENRLECQSLVKVCAAASRTTDLASYNAMVSQAALALWVLSVQEINPDFNIVNAYQLLENSPEALACDEQKFRRWHSNGHTLLRLIHASSVHVLLAIAISTLRDVTNHLLDGVVAEVENALRQPQIMDHTMAGLVFSGIIQFVRNMQTYIPTGLCIRAHCFGVNLADDDRYLTKMLRYGRKDFTQLPRGSHWNNACDPFPTPRRLDDANLRGPTAVIKTNFDPEMEVNRLLPAELRAAPKRNAQWTEAERTKASLAFSPDTLDDFSAELCRQLESGVKIPNSYIKLSSQLCAESNVLIHGVGGVEEGLIAFVMSGDTLTPAEKDYILQIVKITLGINNEAVNTAEVGPEYEFDGHHYGVWGKMSKSGKLAPKKMHPRIFLGESCQPYPYLDRAMRLLSGNFNASHFMHCPLTQFNRAIEVILQPAIAKLKQYVPGLLQKHVTLHQSLNPTFQLGSAPFCMAVLNIQPVTRAHRDFSDEIDSICLILALGDYEGGELCLYEAGICMELRHGAFAAIRSKRDVHFNLHFKGQRFSFVFTSDSCLRQWKEKRNNMRDLQDSSSTEGSGDDGDVEDEEDIQDE